MNQASAQAISGPSTPVEVGVAGWRTTEHRLVGVERVSISRSRSRSSSAGCGAGGGQWATQSRPDPSE